MPQTIGIPKETFAGEKRVATAPEVVEKLIKLGFAVQVETGAGEGSNFPDDALAAAGAKILSAADLYATSDIIFKVRAPDVSEVAKLKSGTTLISFIWPAQNPDLMQSLKNQKVTVLAMDAVPRLLSRAQKMDALTSMAGISGYRAVIEAANAFGRYFNGQITAAGKVQPAKVFIAGAGVAGLAAIGTAAGLGAIVRANDTRAEVADQVKSLGGEFVKVDYEEEGSGGGGYAKVMSEGFQKAQREMYAKQAKDVDIIITTALIPGKPAPKLITAEMVRSMKPGSVIVDMAGEQGGNCELSEPGKAVVKHGVTIIAYTDLASRLAKQSSSLYANNLLRLTEELCKAKDGQIVVNMEDDAIEDAAALAKLTALFRRIQPDLVHANTPKAGLLGMMAAAAAGVSARIYEMHGSLLYTARGSRRRLLKATERVACALASRVVAVSGSLRDFAIAERLASPEKLQLLASGSCNGVDCDGMFDPSRVTEDARDALRRRLGVPRDALVVTFIGRLVREKGVVELVQAWHDLRDRFPKAHLVVAGVFEERDPVPAETRAALEGDPRLHFAGFVEETPALYAISDVVVLPSYREGFPFVPLEAASMCVPVVATRVPGCVDAVVDGDTGTLVPPRDAHAIADAIAVYLASPPLRARHGAAARARASDQFRQERIWQALAALYDELMPRASAAARAHEVAHR